MQILHTDNFEGPLDLLLQLVNEQKLAITEVALAQVTGQFFGYVKKMPEGRTEELADFLVVATKLVYLKSRELLPAIAPEEADGLALADQLRLYQKFVVASQKVLAYWREGNVAYGRLEPPLRPAEVTIPGNARPNNLHAVMLAILERLKPVDPIPHVAIDRTITVRGSLQKIFDFLKRLRRASFSQLFGGAKSKTEIIVGFLALLELVKQEKVSAAQPSAFGEMEIEHI